MQPGWGWLTARTECTSTCPVPVPENRSYRITRVTTTIIIITSCGLHRGPLNADKKRVTRGKPPLVCFRGFLTQPPVPSLCFPSAERWPCGSGRDPFGSSRAWEPCRAKWPSLRTCWHSRAAFSCSSRMLDCEKKHPTSATREATLERLSCIICYCLCLCRIKGHSVPRAARAASAGSRVFAD